MDIPLLDRFRYAPVGVCIFCGGTEDLTDEHIMPFGLGGNLILPDASCRTCAKVTGRIERVVLRGPLRPIRVFRGIQSRRRHRDAPTSLPLRVMFADEWETVYLPHHEYPLMLNFHVFAPPGLGDPTYERGIRVQGSAAFNFGARPEEVLAKLGGKQIQVHEEHDPSAFAKMTAKVGYAFAVAAGAIDPRRGRPQVVRSLFEDTNDIGRWVGTSPEPEQKLPQALHFVWVGRDDARGLLIARVQYLSDTGTPMYLVILGDMTDDYVCQLPN
jgi:hypothetical protein